MDISKYRDNTELSDICVVIEDQEFNLHKFPLSINCEYFKNECKNQSKVTFNQFPGGKGNFEIIADHCYGKDVELTMETVASVFCSAEFLGMGGKSNLIEKCEKFIDRIFRSSEFSHSIDGIIALLQSCKLAKDEKLSAFVDRGLSIIIQIWLRPLSGYKSNLKEKYIEDSIVFETILKLNSCWIEEIVKRCSVDESKFPFIAKLVVCYIEEQLFSTESENKFNNTQSNNILNEKLSIRRVSSSSLSSNEDIKEITSEKDSSKDFEILLKNTTPESRKEIFDNVIDVLPNEIGLGKIVTIDWFQKALNFCKKYDSKMKDKLLQLCNGILTHATVEDLKSMDPKNVTEIIEHTLNNDTINKELMKWIWDHHFLQMAQNAELNPVLFNKIVKNMSESQKADPNIIFKIVLSILNNSDSDGHKYKDELITSVDLEQISPENLEEASESKLWDNEIICKVAIKRLKDRSFYKSENIYSTKDSKSNFDQSYLGNDNKISTSFKSHLYQTHLNPHSSLYDEETYATYPENVPNYYPISKYRYSAYFPDTYLTWEENLNYELKRISDSYTTYNKKKLRSRSRRTQLIVHQCPI